MVQPPAPELQACIACYCPEDHTYGNTMPSACVFNTEQRGTRVVQMLDGMYFQFGYNLLRTTVMRLACHWTKCHYVAWSYVKHQEKANVYEVNADGWFAEIVRVVREKMQETLTEDRSAQWLDGGWENTAQSTYERLRAIHLKWEGGLRSILIIPQHTLELEIIGIEGFPSTRSCSKQMKCCNGLHEKQSFDALSFQSLFKAQQQELMASCLG